MSRRALLQVAGSAALVFAGCSDTDTPPESAGRDSGVEREIRGFQLSETQAGRLIWELHADTAWRIPKDTQVHLEEVEVRFFDQDGRLDSRLTSRRGLVDEATGTMTAKEDVRLISVNQDTLTTQELVYLKDEDLVRGPGAVRLAKPDRVVTGFEFEAKPDLTTYEIHRDVRITLVGDRRDGTP